MWNMHNGLPSERHPTDWSIAPAGPDSCYQADCLARPSSTAHATLARRTPHLAKSNRFVRRSTMIATVFTKRIYTLPTFTADVKNIFDHLDDLRQAARGGRISKVFAEKIMLVVSRVNGCRYCSYGHSRAALAAGISELELQNLIALDLGTFPVNETVALTFAQHYAEAKCQPDPSAWQRVLEYYGEETANDILAYLRMITFGNLFGNTFDALLSRLAGRPAVGSSLWSELGILLGVFWLVPSRLLLWQRHRKQSSLSDNSSFIQHSKQGDIQ
jgi:AhpD family alkylhydroperoxidase